MRLIDADELLAKETQAYNNVKLELSGKNDKMSTMTRAVNECVHKLVHFMVNGAPTAGEEETPKPRIETTAAGFIDIGKKFDETFYKREGE